MSVMVKPTPSNACRNISIQSIKTRDLEVSVTKRIKQQ